MWPVWGLPVRPWRRVVAHAGHAQCCAWPGVGVYGEVHVGACPMLRVARGGRICAWCMRGVSALVLCMAHAWACPMLRLARGWAYMCMAHAGACLCSFCAWCMRGHDYMRRLIRSGDHVCCKPMHGHVYMGQVWPWAGVAVGRCGCGWVWPWAGLALGTRAYGLWGITTVVVAWELAWKAICGSRAPALGLPR